MSETEKIDKINIDNLSSALRGLRRVNTKNGDYADILTKLHYVDPVSVNPAQFDALLIRASDELFMGIDTDIILMSLGLLLRYERRIRIGKRRENFLRYSNYIQDFYYDNKGPYDAVDSIQKKKYRDSLINAEVTHNEDLAEFLAKISMEGKLEEYIKNLDGYYDHNNDIAILKVPDYMVKQGEINESEKKPEKDDSKGASKEVKKSGSNSARKEKRIKIRIRKKESVVREHRIKFSVSPLYAITVFMLLLIAIIKLFNNTIIERANSEAIKAAESILPDEIKIINKNIQLSPGEGDYIKVETRPKLLEPEKLFYRSSDDDIVSPENLHSPHIIAAGTLKDGAERKVSIIVHGDGYAKDTATVQIIERDADNADTGSVGNGNAE